MLLRFDKSMFKCFKLRHKSQSAISIEYGLILASILLACIAVFVLLGA